jgi:hypothetical protein
MSTKGILHLLLGFVVLHLDDRLTLLQNTSRTTLASRLEDRDDG